MPQPYGHFKHMQLEQTNWASRTTTQPCLIYPPPTGNLEIDMTYFNDWNNNIANELAPVTTSNGNLRRNPPTPWFTPNIAECRHLCKRLERAWRKA